MKQYLSRLLQPAAVAMACAVLFAAPFARTAKAEAYTERSFVTFSNDVEIPGQMLPAGTYVFQLAPDMGGALNLDRLQIFDASGTQLIATVNTVPTTLAYGPNNPLVQLSEAPAGFPARVREFVFQGSTYGHHFVYKDSQQGR
jgi:hypothetical protein